jgi:hypothetical protein
MKRQWVVAAALIFSGCDTSPSSAPSVTTKPKKPPIETAAEPQAPQFAPKVGEAVAPASPPPPVEMVREVARAGVSDKGKYDAGIVTTPLTANFSIQQQLIFDAQIPKAMQLFEGINNRKPNSHQEFMSQIIVKSSIRLPSLPPGHRYVYDPELGELMVERPKTGN